MPDTYRRSRACPALHEPTGYQGRVSFRPCPTSSCSFHTVSKMPGDLRRSEITIAPGSWPVSHEAYADERSCPAKSNDCAASSRPDPEEPRHTLESHGVLLRSIPSRPEI